MEISTSVEINPLSQFTEITWDYGNRMTLFEKPLILTNYLQIINQYLFYKFFNGFF